ncbi:hypothetical protein [Nocardia sp. NPDC050718]|uniref:hypothetical protein n=1 Tax=Nocardia sp. NPDC050718 TaxID=3155788 RepID=UPI0033CFE7B6
MAWTILRPTQFASNALWWAPAIRESGGVEIPFADIGLPTIHPGDIAAVAALAATDDTVARITGRQPRPFHEWVTHHLTEFR